MCEGRNAIMLGTWHGLYVCTTHTWTWSISEYRTMVSNFWKPDIFMVSTCTVCSMISVVFNDQGLWSMMSSGRYCWPVASVLSQRQACSPRESAILDIQDIIRLFPHTPPHYSPLSRYLSGSRSHACIPCCTDVEHLHADISSGVEGVR